MLKSDRVGDFQKGCKTSPLCLVMFVKQDPAGQGLYVLGPWPCMKNPVICIYLGGTAHQPPCWHGRSTIRCAVGENELVKHLFWSKAAKRFALLSLLIVCCSLPQINVMLRRCQLRSLIHPFVCDVTFQGKIQKLYLANQFICLCWQGVY